jgi:hypothetical protein
MNILKPTAKLEEIINSLTLSELEPEDQEEVLLELNDIIFESAVVRVAELMDAKTQEAFEALLDQEADEVEIEEFLEKNVPNADTAVKEVVEEITNDILAVTKE